MLAHVGFRPVIFEDRPDFADPKDFPGAVQTLVGDLANFGASIQVRRQDYIAIMTRGIWRITGYWSRRCAPQPGMWGSSAAC